MIALKNQLTFNNFMDNFDELTSKATPKLFHLFNTFIDIDTFIPSSFKEEYYSTVGSPREYSLSSMINFFILKNILGFSESKQLLNILHISNDIRKFCGFTKVPHESQISRFNTNYLKYINEMFHQLVDITEPMCKEINSYLATILISDTTGFEAYVKENNPKFHQTLINQGKKIAKFKDNKSFDVDKYAQSQTPKKSTANSDIKLAYLNGHFGFYLKANVVTNGLGVVRHIDFYDDDMDFTINPSSAKDLYDATTLIPVLDNYFNIHPKFKYFYFLGDSGFDAIDNYTYLVKDKDMIPIIPLNQRNQSNLPKPGFSPLGIPTCPYDSSLEMKYDGITREKGRSDRIKYLCPKSIKCKLDGRTAYKLSCDNPCTSSKCGRVIQVSINSDYRVNTKVPRNTQQWQDLYKIRTVCERAIAQLKSCMGLKSTQLRDTRSIKSNILFAGITQLIALIIFYKSGTFTNVRAIKTLVA
ncbi:MAG: transposase [Cetobacterium sp.]